MVDYENPWTFEGASFLSENIDDNFGFVYLITNIKNGRQYIGRKYFWSNREISEVNLGELNLKATGKNTTAVLTNLTQIVKRLETNISEEKY